MENKLDINLKTVYDILMAVEQKRQYSNIATNNIIDKNEPTKPAFVREIVYGVLENKQIDKGKDKRCQTAGFNNIAKRNISARVYEFN